MSNLTLIGNKIKPLNALTTEVKKWQKNGDKVVFTNGVFDLLHLGHIDYLSKTADCGSKLIIGLNSDASVKRLNKGPARPIKDEQTRAFILASLQFVDAVLIFDQDTPFEIIDALQPDVLIKGGDYDPHTSDSASKKYIVGSDIVKQNGGEVKVIAFLPGHSTTTLEQKIISLNK